MRRIILLCTVLCALVFTNNVQAQDTVSSIEDLDIQFWPDFDQRSVLVLLTGTLSNAGTVTVPFPEDGDFLVLARIDSNNTMIDDIGQPDIANGTATFSMPGPDLTFRLEYYVPYTANGDSRSFSYTWQADVPVNQAILRVQRPAAATSMTTVPEATSQVQSQNDGLLYFEMPAQSIGAGQPLSVQVNYTMGADTLTVNTLSTDTETAMPPTSGTTGGETAVSPSTGSNINIGLILGGIGLVLITGVVTWQIASRQGGRRIRKPAPRRTSPKARSSAPSKKKPGNAAPSRKTVTRFCHECGEPAQPGDRFCRNCGATLRQG